VDKNETIIESSAILMYLAEKYKNILNLVPEDEEKYFEYIIFACSTRNYFPNFILFSVDDLVTPLLLYLVFTPKEKQEESIIQGMVSKITPKLEYLEEKLGSDDYFVGNSFSCVDIMLGYSIATCANFKLLEKFSGLSKFAGNVSSRKAFQRSMAPEESTDVKSLQKQLKQMKFENSTLKGEKKEKQIPMLYHIAGSRSTRIAWLLNELEVEYVVNPEMEKKGFSYLKNEEYLKVNPHGTVPSYIDENGKVLIEAGAIFHAIVETHKDQLIAKGLMGTDWSDEVHNKYMFWAIATMDSRILSTTQIIKALAGSSVGSFLNSSKFTKWFTEDCCNIIVKDLGENKYINGKEFSITDIILGYTIGHAFKSGLLKTAPKKVQEYHQLVLNRTSFLGAAKGSLFTLV
jgi:glutathione S-transferase